MKYKSVFFAVLVCVQSFKKPKRLDLIQWPKRWENRLKGFEKMKILELKKFYKKTVPNKFLEIMKNLFTRL